MRRLALDIVLLGLAITSGFLPGCGNGGNSINVTGVLLKGEAKYTPPQGHVVTITFVCLESETPSGKTSKLVDPYIANLNRETGVFDVPGRDGRGIPPGKYRIAITQKMTREAFEAAKIKTGPSNLKPDREKDFLDQRFDLDTSPLVREIKETTNLVIDLDKPNESVVSPG